jgi:hypothetical protein
MTGQLRFSRLPGIGAATLAALALLFASASPASAAQSVLSLTFGSRTPSTPSSMRLYILYRKPSDPNGKPSEIRHLVVDGPAGTVFDVHAVPACTASNTELTLLGRGACPARRRSGRGR